MLAYGLVFVTQKLLMKFQQRAPHPSASSSGIHG